MIEKNTDEMLFGLYKTGSPTGQDFPEIHLSSISKEI
jgi:hypothetical protein